MIDEIAIQQTINRYSNGASRRDWDQVVATYAPDGVWEIASSGTKFVGHDKIREGLMTFTKATEYMVQLNAPAVITVNGDRASADSAIREGGKLAGSDVAVEALGFYTDQLIRTAEGWKFTHRKFELRGMRRFQPLGDGHK